MARELEQLGASNIQQHNRVVSFSGSEELLYKSNLWLRTALRVLMPVRKFQVAGESQLYDAIQKIDWREYIDLKMTFAIDAVVNSEHFSHSKYPALKAKDAIVDQFREQTKRRPDIDTDQPDVRINLHIFKEECTVSLDSSGDSLHKRGYRLDQVEAPLNEVLAAGMVLLSGWDGKSAFVDPMCGSGTLAIEAGMLLANKAPGLLKKQFGFFRWKNFDAKLWQAVLSEAENAIQPIHTPILAADQSPKAYSISGDNIERAGLNGIDFVRKPFNRLKAPAGEGVIIMNPPYGERMEEPAINKLYKQIGDILKQNWTGYHAWVLSANKEAIKNVGLRTSQKMTLFNGPLECKFHEFELYQGKEDGL